MHKLRLVSVGLDNSQDTNEPTRKKVEPPFTISLDFLPPDFQKSRNRNFGIKTIVSLENLTNVSAIVD